MENLTEKDRLIVFMAYCEISNKKQEAILEEFDSIDSLLKEGNLFNLLSTEEYHKFVKYDKQALDACIENMLKKDIKILTIYSKEYPKRLIDLPDRPLILFAKGDLSLLDKPSVAIVGTRTPTNYGKIVTEKFSGEIAKSGLVVISGLCYGVDAIAHRKTLQVGGKTIAVVGSGFQNIYPAVNTSLSLEVAESGLLLSEYPPSFKAKRYTFPKRNRIVAGLSDGVLIPEAGIKSGTIHTKEYALDYGKDVFAVPGNINSDKSELPNHLIKTGQAVCAISANDIIEYYGFEKQAKKQKAISLNFDEQTIVNLLSSGEKDFEFLVENSKLSVNILNSCLTTLEIRGLIRKLPAQTYALI